MMDDPNLINPDGVIRPSEKYIHRLPASVDFPLRSLAACSTCHKWFRIEEEYIGFGFDKVWRQVHWYHWRSRGRIKAAHSHQKSK